MTDSETALCLYDRLLRLIASMEMQGKPAIADSLIERLERDSGVDPAQLSFLVPMIRMLMSD